ncbi:MAG: hypothetical protein ACYS9X_29590, partial [Planctomycetota bacterium]
EREIRRLTELGVDVGALGERFEGTKASFAEEDWDEVESGCAEILVLAKSMQAITAASMKSTSRRKGSGKLTEAMRLEMTKLIGAEVANRVEAVARTLPTASALEEVVQTKIQEALVTGGLIDRLESIAGDKAQAAIANIPRFTAKDAQAAANLVVQRALTQFLSSKQLATRINGAVEAAMTKALANSEAQFNKAMEALVDSRVASAVGEFPSKDDMKEGIETSLDRFLKEAPFEERVLELAAERAKAELQRAPDTMTEAATRFARQEADSLLKAYLRGTEFTEQVKALTKQNAAEIVTALPQIAQEDVEIIARRVADESLGSLADSEMLQEKVEGLAKQVVDDALSAQGFDEKIRSVADDVAKNSPTKEELAEAITASRRELMTNEDFGSWIKDGALEAMREAGLAGLGDIEKKLLTEDRVERIARHEALSAVMDLLEKKDFVKRIAEVLDEKLVKAKIEEIAGGGIDSDQIDETAEVRAKSVFAELIESDEFAQKVQEVGGGGGGGGSEQLQEVAKRLAERMELIEKEALPALVEGMLQDKLGSVSADAIGKQVSSAVQEAITAQVNPQALQQQMAQIAKDSIAEIANTDEFKALLEGKFKVMLNYITKDVIPKQITRIMGGG